MEYYKLLQLDREPFSNSPDPDYFFQSRQHLECLQKLELAIRLKRGLNVVIGDVGTGKTTLCRQIIRKFTTEAEFETYLILDPSFETPEELLSAVYDFFRGPLPHDHPTASELKESIKQSLFAKGIDEQKTVVLIIDEGQKISQSCVEVLRELLNYETNTFKLLQIVIFAQSEFDGVLESHANFADRINLLHYLAPLNFKDTRQMVQHRLKLSSTEPKPRKLFTFPAMWAIYRASRGYPRKIIHLCHQSLLAMIIQNRSKAGWAIIQSSEKRLANSGRRGYRYLFAGIVLAAVAAIIIGLSPNFRPPETAPQQLRAFKIAPPQQHTAIAEKPLIKSEKTDDPAPQKSDMPEPGTDVAVVPSAVAKTIDTASKPKDENRSNRTTGNTPARFPEPDKIRAVSSPAAPPKLLGQVFVKPGDTLVNLVHIVYGTYRSKHLRAVIDANPHIENPNKIEIGDLIVFPPLPNWSKTKNINAYWIILDEFQSLPSATQRYSQLEKALPVPIQMIPHWRHDSGLRYFISLKGYFQNEKEARSYIKALPEDILSQSRVMSAWPEQTLFYTNIYEGGVLNLPSYREAVN